jgi:Lar family restriction alleviation protein
VNDKLISCPFCGGHVQYVRSDPAYGITGIFCNQCKAMIKWNIEMEPKETYGENERKWRERWNRRANDEPGTA